MTTRDQLQEQMRLLQEARDRDYAKRKAEEDSRKMRVGTLIEELKKLDPNLPVSMEGCDCDGWLGGVTVQSYRDESNVYLTRI